VSVERSGEPSVKAAEGNHGHAEVVESNVDLLGGDPLTRGLLHGLGVVTNEIARRLTSGDSGDVCQLWVAEEASDDLR